MSSARSVRIEAAMSAAAACMVGSVMWLVSSVSTKPGWITITRTPRRVTSWRSDSEKALMPNFVAAYTPLPRDADRAAVDDTCTTAPFVSSR